MVLVDTSVWIRFLTGREPYLSEMHRVLAAGEVAGHEMVYGELLIGDPGGRTKLLTSYTLMQQVRCIPHVEVAGFVRHHKLHGRGAGWIDVHLLASAVVEQMPFWTADKVLSDMAEQLGTAYNLLPKDH